jgi:hypothetical protein
MGSFEWMELQTLTSEITAARSRLSGARSSKNAGRIRGLEEEIAAAEARRTGLLAHITTNLAGTPRSASGPHPTDDDDAAPAPAEEAQRDAVEAELQSGPPANQNPGNDAASPAASPNPDSAEGGCIMWDRLTPGDIASATNALGARRAEVLARHAAELNGLDADQTQLESLERAIEAFVQKLNRMASEGGVATLEDDRDLRLRAHG